VRTLRWYLEYLNPTAWTAIGYQNAMLTIIAIALIAQAVQ
jgi:hypothetical protein